MFPISLLNEVISVPESYIFIVSWESWLMTNYKNTVFLKIKVKLNVCVTIEYKAAEPYITGVIWKNFM